MSAGKGPLEGPLLSLRKNSVACLVCPPGSSEGSACSTGDHVPCPDSPSLGSLRSQACAVARDFPLSLLAQTKPVSQLWLQFRTQSSLSGLCPVPARTALRNSLHFYLFY